MPNYSAPGVYVEEISLLAPSIAEVESAIPAFIGYTEKATSVLPDDLLMVPTPISNIDDFKLYFGGPAMEDPSAITIDVDEIQSGDVTTNYNVSVAITAANLTRHIFYQCMKHFFNNGGGNCYVVSVGDYSGNPTEASLLAGLNLIEDVDEPTMLVVPEAVTLGSGEFNNINTAMITQAANLKDRFAIMDTLQTTYPKTPGSVQLDVNTAITAIPPDKEIRRYGGVYYPWLETSFNYSFDLNALPIGTHTVNGAAPIAPVVDQSGAAIGVLENTLSLMYNAISAKFKEFYMVLPPSAAIAGIYTRVDNTRGYWKAPANVGVANVIRPRIALSQSEHGALNINTTTGKSVNGIISKPGYSALVMGARTLDGNDNEWRYVNVRRFFSVVEESIKKSTSWVVFEPNVASTWVKVQAMIENFLFQKWRDGALAGATPSEAYYVNVGLNKTMNAIDILEGRLNVEIGMAVARPAEFIILKFQHKMQTS